MDELSPQAARDQETVRAVYGDGAEGSRLEVGLGRLEYLRSRDILGRVLPSPPVRVYDVGGGPGRYLRWLVEVGHEVYLVDPVPNHVVAAQAVVEAHQGSNRGAAYEANALALPFASASGDVVLLFGPLYHLKAREDRLRALSEARRVLRPGGLLAAMAIGRFSTFLDSLDRRLLRDEAFAKIVGRGLRTGVHDNPDQLYSHFSSAFLHHPDELEAEVVEAGFGGVQLVAVQGPAWADQELEEDLNDQGFRERLLALLREVEGDPSLMGASPHVMALGWVAPVPAG